MGLNTQKGGTCELPLVPMRRGVFLFIKPKRGVDEVKKVLLVSLVILLVGVISGLWLGEEKLKSE